MASLSTGDTLGAIYHTTNNMSNKIDSVYDTLLNVLVAQMLGKRVLENMRVDIPPS